MQDVLSAIKFSSRLDLFTCKLADIHLAITIVLYLIGRIIYTHQHMKLALYMRSYILADLAETSCKFKLFNMINRYIFKYISKCK